MKTVNVMIRAALAGMGADGLCNPDHECGCGTDDLAPCDCVNLSECVPAKWTIPKDEEYRAGYYRVIE